MKLFIIVIVILCVLAAVVPIMVGRQTFDGLAVEKPYEQGLRWDEEQRARAEAGWSLSLRNGPFTQGKNSVVFELRDRDERPFHAEKVLLVLTRPSSAAYDRSYDVEAIGMGEYRSSVDFPLRGQWDMRITVFHGGRTVTLEERIFAEPKGGAKGE